MIKVKLTEMGGYVVGDGPCPFNPDKFLVAFSTKIMEAKLRGMPELEISDEDLHNFLEDFKSGFNEQLNAAPVLELNDNISERKLLKEVVNYV